MSHDYFNELTNGSVVDVNNNPLTGSARDRYIALMKLFQTQC